MRNRKIDVLGSELRALTPQEWIALRTKVDAFFAIRGISVSPARSSVGAGSLLLDALQRALVRHGKATPRQPFPRDNKAQETAEAVFSHVLKSLGELKVPQRMYAADQLAEVLIGYLPIQRTPVTVRHVLLNIDKIPVALDRAFPGYARAGLLSYVLAGKRREL